MEIGICGVTAVPKEGSKVMEVTVAERTQGLFLFRRLERMLEMTGADEFSDHKNSLQAWLGL